jgi:D-arabinose 1-dehydrogenase-like Zn-dependent alcohol dehydrogenase
MDRRKLGLLGFAAIALAAISLAALQFTNVTYWSVNATLPPAMKYPGADTGITGRNDGSGYNNYYMSHTTTVTVST